MTPQHVPLAVELVPGPQMLAFRRIVRRVRAVRGVPRLLYWLRRAILPAGATAVRTIEGEWIAINRDDYGQLMLFYLPYCPELRALLSDLVQPGDTCLDLGANVGVLSGQLARLVGPFGRVVAVEPNPVVAASLQAVAARHYHPCLHVVTAAIGGQCGRGYLERPQGGFSETVEVLPAAAGAGAVMLLSVDALVADLLGGVAPALIKVDIEGAEAELPAAMEILLAAGARPMILVEFHPAKIARRGATAEQVRAALRSWRYDERKVESAGDRNRLVPVGEPTGHENLLFATDQHRRANAALRRHWAGESA